MRELSYEFYGHKNAENILIQPVDDHDLSEMTNEMKELKRCDIDDALIIAVKVPEWNTDLSPWVHPPVYGKVPFGNGASAFLDDIMALIDHLSLPGNYYIAGYSLAGLFALWSVYQTDFFCGAAGVSPSVWYRGWLNYVEKRKPKTQKIYLSLGTKEEKTRNQFMSKVGNAIRTYDEMLEKQNIHHILAWNPGNHFADNGIRMAKGIAWLLKNE